jgi:hypothetical protein
MSSNDAKAISSNYLMEKALLGLSVALRTACSVNAPPVWARLQRPKNFRSPRCFPILAALLFDP